MTLPAPVPENALLATYSRRKAYTDCYAVTVPGTVTLPDFIFAFYTTRLFKVERWILAKVVGRPSTDAQALSLADAKLSRFAAWDVEGRTTNEVLLAAGPTRSWLSVEPVAGAAPSTMLRFGSAVVSSRADGRFDLLFHLLLGFHRLYSKQLLSAAAKRVVALEKVQWENRDRR